MHLLHLSLIALLNFTSLSSASAYCVPAPENCKWGAKDTTWMKCPTDVHFCQYGACKNKPNHQCCRTGLPEGLAIAEYCY
ncbi:hypothetical protein Vi05172_g2687 [Venturia inaequalis]|nr:hypothetical protein Vi05172_g2687 [Venturia inaequalis]